MAVKQIQINLQMHGAISENDLDLIVYEAAKMIQSRVPCRIVGYGVVEIPSPTLPKSISPTNEPALPEATIEQSAPIRLAIEEALL